MTFPRDVRKSPDSRKWQSSTNPSVQSSSKRHCSRGNPASQYSRGTPRLSKILWTSSSVFRISSLGSSRWFASVDVSPTSHEYRKSCGILPPFCPTVLSHRSVTAPWKALKMQVRVATSVDSLCRKQKFQRISSGKRHFPRAGDSFYFFLVSLLNYRFHSRLLSGLLSCRPSCLLSCLPSCLPSHFFLCPSILCVVGPSLVSFACLLRAFCMFFASAVSVVFRTDQSSQISLHRPVFISRGFLFPWFCFVSSPPVFRPAFRSSSSSTRHSFLWVVCLSGFLSVLALARVSDCSGRCMAVVGWQSLHGGRSMAVVAWRSLHGGRWMGVEWSFDKGRSRDF